jgi:uncharacterized protein HemX
MDPISNNQMNSMYQAPAGKSPEHKTSTLSIVILLIIAIIVAILGFGRINNLKDEDAKLKQQDSMRQQSEQSRARAEQNRKAQDANILNDLNDISADTSASEMTKIESSF